MNNLILSRWFGKIYHITFKIQKMSYKKFSRFVLHECELCKYHFEKKNCANEKEKKDTHWNHIFVNPIADKIDDQDPEFQIKISDFQSKSLLNISPLISLKLVFAFWTIPEICGDWRIWQSP